MNLDKSQIIKSKRRKSKHSRDEKIKLVKLWRECGLRSKAFEIKHGLREGAISCFAKETGL